MNGGRTLYIDRTIFTTIGPRKAVTLTDFNFTQNNIYSNLPVGTTVQLGEIVGTNAKGQPIYDENDKALVSYYEKSGFLSRDAYIWGQHAYRLNGTATVIAGGKLQVVGELRPFIGNFDFEANLNLVDIARLPAYIATILAFPSKMECASISFPI